MIFSSKCPEWRTQRQRQIPDESECSTVCSFFRCFHKNWEKCSVYHSVHLGSHWTDLYEIWCVRMFRKSVERIQVRLTLILLTWRIWRASSNASRWKMRFNPAFKGLISEKNNANFALKSSIHLWPYLAQFFLEWEMLQTKMQRRSKHTFYGQ